MKKILVIDDERALRETLLEILSFENFETLEAEDGIAGVQVAQKHLPDLILCDIAMPGLDGFGVLTALRNDPHTASIPVILLTARAEKAFAESGMSMGANAYITKPFTIDSLLDTIASQLD